MTKLCTPTERAGDILFLVWIICIGVDIMLLCKISRGLAGRLEPDLHGYNIGADEDLKLVALL